MRIQEVCLRLALGFALCNLFMPRGLEAEPFDSATVTRLQNQVSLGNHAGGNERPAMLHDIVKAKTYLFTQKESRAELQFADHSIVRVGQNTVFSFDAESRTLSLEKGAMLFYVPPESGGGNIKTPSLTAAITGTVAKVSANMIAVLSGSIKTRWGIVHAGQAIENVNGAVRIFAFDPSQATAGRLLAWGGPLPELPEIGGETNPLYAEPDIEWLDMLGIAQVDSHFHSNSPFFPQPDLHALNVMGMAQIASHFHSNSPFIKP